MKLKQVFVLGMVSGIVACSTQTNTASSLEQWNNVGNVPFAVPSLKENQAVVVFYRENDFSNSVANIFIDGDYQSSLSHNTYSTSTICANKHSFTSSLSNSNGYWNRKNGGTYILPSHSVTYLKIGISKNQLPTLQEVPAEVAQEELKNLSLSTNTISRVVSAANCNEFIVDNMQIEASALFPINKSGYKDIQAKGKNDIKDFAQKTKSFDSNQITKIVVGGHTDPDGSDSYNLKLSQKRANTVRQILLKEGVTLPIEAIGYGEKELKVATCSDTTSSKSERIRCNQPNRRVEVSVLGKSKD